MHSSVTGLLGSRYSDRKRHAPTRYLVTSKMNLTFMVCPVGTNSCRIQPFESKNAFDVVFTFDFLSWPLISFAVVVQRLSTVLKPYSPSVYDVRLTPNAYCCIEQNFSNDFRSRTQTVIAIVSYTLQSSTKGSTDEAENSQKNWSGPARSKFCTRTPTALRGVLSVRPIVRHLYCLRKFGSGIFRAYCCTQTCVVGGPCVYRTTTSGVFAHLLRRMQRTRHVYARGKKTAWRAMGRKTKNTSEIREKKDVRTQIWVYV